MTKCAVHARFNILCHTCAVARREENINALAQRLADRILTLNGKKVITRIALKSGPWPEGERDNGGYCEKALVDLLRDALLHEPTLDFA